MGARHGGLLRRAILSGEFEPGGPATETAHGVRLALRDSCERMKEDIRDHRRHRLGKTMAFVSSVEAKKAGSDRRQT
ncbi:hypothetical protein SAMN04488245_10132 [Alloyangia pacifica]|uniref:Uncharacterized protein n=2 Tax=Alloyangia pacifica TaxID=311180 RepID=A0A1I6QFJ1_9RHOB|nr:hypothetical protein SAMN04488245_10132 [Alloyangia pacifica]SFS51058.1 hypothetical protein SAMN04488050_10233 [Alloyangia pacifica]